MSKGDSETGQAYLVEALSRQECCVKSASLLPCPHVTGKVFRWGEVCLWSIAAGKSDPSNGVQRGDHSACHQEGNHFSGGLL